MKIVFTGGGTGGHFYPIIAVAQEINRMVAEQHIVRPKMYFMAPAPHDEGLLHENGIKFVRIPAGKLRTYMSVMNIVDIILTPFSILKALWMLLFIYPDAIFSKGGYGSFPVVFAARFLRIPVILHESDTVPGRVNRWTGKFAHRVALSYPEAAAYFPQAPVAVVGNPIRRDIQIPSRESGKEFFAMAEDIPVILVLGGSQGSKIINESILDTLAALTEKYFIIHQTGSLHIQEITGRAKLVLEKSEHKDRYRPYENLKALDLKMASGAASIVISRAGSTIFEIASWALPSIIIPIKESNGDHQRKNAFAYAHRGACTVIEENNLTPHVLIAEIEHILGDAALQEKMKTAAQSFATREASEKIAKELVAIGVSHEII